MALAEGLFGKTATVLDYGCGRGDDVRMLRRKRIPAHGWDPSPVKAKYCTGGSIGKIVVQSQAPYDVVNLGFVLNVIEDSTERARTLRKAYKLTRKVMLVAVRTTSSKIDPKEAVNRLGWRLFNDGLITSTGTFQKFYTQAEFQQYLEDTLKKRVIMAAPGIAYVFRSRSLERLYLTLRYPQPSVKRVERRAR